MNALRGTLADGWAITRRDLTHWITTPGQIVAELAFPIVFIVLFGYVFGSGIVVPGGGDYREFLMPGMFAQTMAFGIGVTVCCGLVVGWSWHEGLGSALLAFALLLLLRFAFVWIGIFLGLVAPNPESVNAIWSLLFPVTMITSAFVAPELMPGWLGTIAEWNPLSATIGAGRELFGNPGVSAGGSWPAEHAMLLAVVWPLVIVAIFVPLSVWRFQRMSR